eukprot:jgi/Chlat1/6949/Chrsp52S06615
MATVFAGGNAANTSNALGGQEHTVGNSFCGPLRQLVANGYHPATIAYIDADTGKPVQLWIDIFRRSIPAFRARAAADASVPDAGRLADQFAINYDNIMQRVEKDPLAYGELNCMALCALRDNCLRDLGFRDIFAVVKASLEAAENATSLELLSGVLCEVDAVSDEGERIRNLVRGVFAGNVFDLGTPETAAWFESGAFSFADQLGKLLARPWLYDDLDIFAQHWQTAAHYREVCTCAEFSSGEHGTVLTAKRPSSQVVMFVDNAGADVVLGMIPLAREFLRKGTKVILAANAVPSLNDITHEELVGILQMVRNIDNVIARALDEETLRCISSGSDMPVLDFRRISSELVEAAGEADLIIVEGMGRSIETNLYAKFTCDSLKLGMVKHQEVADALRGRMYDCVCKFDRSSTK